MWTIKYVDKRVDMTKGAMLRDKQHRAGEMRRLAVARCDWCALGGAGVFHDLLRGLNHGVASTHFVICHQIFSSLWGGSPDRATMTDVSRIGKY